MSKIVGDGKSLTIAQCLRGDRALLRSNLAAIPDQLEWSRGIKSPFPIFPVPRDQGLENPDIQP